MFFKKSINIHDDGQTIYAPINGQIIPLEEVNDEVFRQKMMGDGVAIEPHDGKIYAPATGVITVVFPTRHVIAMTSVDGMNIIVHVGIDTVELNGNGFHPLVKVGDYVKAGEQIMTFQLHKIKQNYQATTMIVIENSAEYQLLKSSADYVQVGEELMKVKKVKI
ncbi:PTS sugar transporter subunit IIA [Candidatus Stoquefichus sp. SB1]|uniref:PTS sugar transporter subunit IIA n=1 Tax=Candidatus Stoquefichus sp. SB1 TaxID=1658109 RepID=UPI00067F53E4|nr:PTS glucose transporter subunit IIA [Candidatus Stoquefichus sp. SB1]